MKTIEEKARAYDKAIERAKAMIKVAANQDEARGFVNTIFPELAESEDKKIMKEIAEFIYNTAFKPKDIKKKEKWLAWLEKQNGNIGGISSNWSEEDEENFCSVYLDVKSARQNTVNSLSGELKEQEQKRMDEVISWLKSLKGRVGCEANCTTTKEWSEDDKRKIDRIYSILRQAADTHAFSTSCRLIGDKECIELQDFLKSLRPQSRWKPSEGDIMILEKVFNEKIDPKDFQVTLSNVLEQLKKLKEGV